MSEEAKGITHENCRVLLAAYMEKENISAPKISKAIGCSHATMTRILAGITKPTLEFMKQVGIMTELGFKRYKKLSDSDKEKISEAIGATGGGILGFGAITAAVSASGAVAGLSAAGIASGLAAIGAGGMLGGVLTLAAVPIAAGAAGYGVIKGVKYLMSESDANADKIDTKWEIKVTE